MGSVGGRCSGGSLRWSIHRGTDRIAQNTLPFYPMLMTTIKIILPMLLLLLFANVALAERDSKSMAAVLGGLLEPLFQGFQNEGCCLIIKFESPLNYLTGDIYTIIPVAFPRDGGRTSFQRAGCFSVTGIEDHEQQKMRELWAVELCGGKEV